MDLSLDGDVVSLVSDATRGHCTQSTIRGPQLKGHFTHMAIARRHRPFWCRSPLALRLLRLDGLMAASRKQGASATRPVV